MIRPTPKKAKPSLHFEGWGLLIEPSEKGDNSPVYLLWSPWSNEPATLTAKQLASRSTVRVEFIKQCQEYVNDRELDDLFGVKLRAGVYRDGCMAELLMNAVQDQEVSE